jgi:uncharacterized membrane protein
MEGSGRGMTTERTGAFSDGIFAIAATLLVLEIHAPDPATSELWQALAQEWPAYLGYAISFATLGIVWVNHHALLDALTRVDRTVLFLNLLLLAIVGFVPFPTGFLADAFRAGEGQRVATIVYGGTMLAMSTAFSLTWTYVSTRAPELLELPLPEAWRRMKRSWIGPTIYAVAVLVAVVSPSLALVLFALIALYFIHPGRPSAL